MLQSDEYEQQLTGHWFMVFMFFFVCSLQFLYEKLLVFNLNEILVFLKYENLKFLKLETKKSFLGDFLFFYFENDRSFIGSLRLIS